MAKIISKQDKLKHKAERKARKNARGKLWQ